MTVLFWGTYVVAGGYPVNRYLIEGLRRSGVVVEECRAEAWGGFVHEALGRHAAWRLARRAGRCLRAWVRLARLYRRAGPHDWVVVGYPGYLDVLVLRLLRAVGRPAAGRRPIALVAFISLHDTVVADRGQVPCGSWRAGALRVLDRFAFRAADLVLADTCQTARHYAASCGLPQERFRRSFVGHEFVGLEGPRAQAPAAGGDRPGPRVAAGRPWRVLFFGTYVPLHGVEFVLEAAGILRGEEGLEFMLVGRGPLYPALRKRAEDGGLENVCFVDRWLEAGELAAQVWQADVCLGIFGATEKAARVIPYKVFGALALARPLVTRDSPAARELLVDGESALLVRPASGEALAAALLRLRQEPATAASLAAHGHEVYRRLASPEAVGRDLASALEGWHGR
ncbi:MAG: glycosyltransferase [Candidatus Latescibacterota bacterium]